MSFKRFKYLLYFIFFLCLHGKNIYAHGIPSVISCWDVTPAHVSDVPSGGEGAEDNRTGALGEALARASFNLLPRIYGISF